MWPAEVALVALVVVSTGCSSARVTGRDAHPSTTVAKSPARETAPTSTPETTPTPTTIPAPPYSLATFTIRLVDHTRPTVSNGVTIATSRTLTTLVWEPNEPGRWPLLVFAPGYIVGPTPYVALLRSWASQGYVVAAPEFPLTDQAIAGPDLDEKDIQQQPADVRFVIDELVARSGPVAVHIDPSRVGVAGHSDGAETALAVSVQPAPVGEPAIRCAIAMSVSPLVGVTHTSNPPLLVTQGDADSLNLPSEATRTWQEAASPKYLVILHGAGHLPPLEAGSEWFSAIEGITQAFLRAYLARTGTPSAIIASGTHSSLTSITVG